ncbi:MAG: glycosyltransferase [Bacteroidales bacterium]
MIIAGFFIASFGVQMFYYFFFFLRVSISGTNDRIKSSGEAVSVVICARDEAANLENNLPLILEQDYSDYEVVVVNDASEDDTEEVLDRLKNRYSKLRSTRIRKDPRFRHGKKLALTIGLKAAKHDWVLLTDADCRPASPLWISKMQSHFIPSGDIVLGYGGYERKKGLLDKFLRYDTFFIAMQYFSFALAGFPYMGVGRNLAYRRSMFFANKGFASHIALESGDDDLFVNQVARKGNTRVEFSHLAHTYSLPPPTWGAWIRQKRRHLTTGFHYRGFTRFLLGMEMLSRLIFYVSLILLLANKIYLPYAGIIFIIRLISSTLILNMGMNRLNEKKLLVFSPLFDIMIFLINALCVISNSITQKRSRWR